MSGYTFSYRDKWTHPVFRNLLEAGIWSWMCDTAVWKKTKIRFNGILIELDRGQMATSIRFISKGFGIGERMTRSFLENLEKERMIDTRPTHWGTIITICNYDKYQVFENTGDTLTDTRPTHDRHTGDTNKNTINTGNTLNNNFDFSAEQIESWKAAYPKVDIKAEIAKAKSWIMANPKREKKNYARFMNNWLANAKPSITKPKRDNDAILALQIRAMNGEQMI